MNVQHLLRTFFLVALSLNSLCVLAQTEAAAVENRSTEVYQKSMVRFEVTDCISDLRRLEEVLKEAHPCLYCLADSAELHQAFADAISDLEKRQNHLYISKVTENEFLITVRRLLAMVQDGHLYAESNESLVNYVTERGKFFPLSLAVENNEAYIRIDYSGMLDAKASGSQLVSINGEKTADILAKMMPLLSADANLVQAKWRQLENVFTFDILYWTLYEPAETYQIVYRTADGREHTEQINAVSGSTINLANADKEDDYRLNIDEATSTAYLDINTFYNPDHKRANASYQKFMTDTFKQLKEKNVKNLVIDLRDNPGGLVHNAYLLFSYLSPENVESKVMVKSSRFLKEQKKLSFAELLLKRFSRQSYAARIDRAPFGTLVEVTSKYHFLKRNDLRFKGKTYILANGATFSAASMLVKLCKDYGVAVITGEENAACQAVSFGDLIGFDLPNTATKVYVSTSIVTRNDDLEKRSVKPDVAFTRNIQEDANGSDSMLKQLFTLVKTPAAPGVARNENKKD